MRKRICYALVCSMFLAAALSGCGDKKSDTTTAAATTTEAAATEVAGGNDTAAPADTESQSASTGLAAAAKVTFNGVTFGTGDKASEVVAKLGDQVKPSDSSQPCIPDAGEITHYYFKGLTVDASQYDVICSIYFTNENAEGYDAKLAGSAGLGSTGDEFKAALGTPETEDEYGLRYVEGDFGVSITYDNDGKAMSIAIDDLSIQL